MKFEGTERYIATKDLQVAVNAAITLERPLLVKGEPGTGKTMLAHEVAIVLSRPSSRSSPRPTLPRHESMAVADWAWRSAGKSSS